MPNLIIIGGHPGSGKTAISKSLEERGFVRLEIDQFYQQTPRNSEIQNWFDDSQFLDLAYESLKREALKNLSQGKKVVIETTGVGNRWKDLLKELESTFQDQLLTIYLQTSRETSVKRVQERNSTDYPIKMTDEELDKFFRLGKDTSSGYQQVIDADRPLAYVFASVISLVS